MRGCGLAPRGAWPAQPRVPEPWPLAPPACLPAMLLLLLPAKHLRKGEEAVPASTWLRLTSTALFCRQTHDTGVSDFLVTLAKIHSFSQISFFSLCTSPYQSPAGHARTRGKTRERPGGVRDFHLQEAGMKGKVSATRKYSCAHLSQ